MEKNEALEKSIDTLIDELFLETEETPENTKTEEPVQKSDGQMESLIGKPKESSAMKNGSDAGPGKQTADEGEKPPKGKKEKEEENGRPKQVSDVPDEDEDGSRAKGYEHIQKPNSQTPDTSRNYAMVKGEEKETHEISKEDFELLKKAKESAQAEALRKAKEEQATLIKSAVSEATKALKEENERLKKSVEETNNLIKAIAKRPRQPKSITNVQVLEKSFGEDKASRPQTYTKAELLDVAEELVKAKKITLEQAIELEDTGMILTRQLGQRLNES